MTTIIWCGGRFGSFAFAFFVSLCGGGKSKCAKCGWAENYFLKCAVEEIFKTLRWLECWQTELGLCRVTAK